MTKPKKRTEKQKAVDKALLLTVIQRFQPISKERLHAVVFILQKAGFPFSYNDWVEKDEEEDETTKKEERNANPPHKL